MWYMPTTLELERNQYARLEQYDGLGLPKTIQPRQLVYSSYWGCETTYLQADCAEGYLYLTLCDPCHSDINLAKLILPTYLATTVPTIILDKDKYGIDRIRILFLCKDRRPEIMVLCRSWENEFERIATGRRTEQCNEHDRTARKALRAQSAEDLMAFQDRRFSGYSI